MKVKEFLSHVTVEPAAILFMLATKYSYPAQQSLIMHKVCLSHASPSDCTILLAGTAGSNITKAVNDEISSQTSLWMFYVSLAMTLPAVLSAFVLGNWSDKYGKKFVLLLPCFGQCLANVLFLVFSTGERLDFSPIWLIIPSGVSGIFGGYTMFLMAAFGYTSIAAKEEHKTIKITFLELSMSLGTAIGAFTSGLIYDQKASSAFTVGFGLVSGLFVLSFLLILLRISWKEEGALPARLVVGVKDIQEMWQTLAKRREASKRPALLISLGTLSLNFVPVFGMLDILFLYAKAKGVNMQLYGVYSGYSFTSAVLGGGILAYLSERTLHFKETTLAMIGATSKALTMVVLAVAGLHTIIGSSFEVLWWVSPVFAIFGLLGSANLRRITSSLVDLNEQGKIFCFIAIGESLLQLVCSAAYNFFLWPATHSAWPGACFVLSGGLSVMVVGLLMVIRVKLHRISEGSGVSYTDLDQQYESNLSQGGRTLANEIGDNNDSD